MIIKGLFVTGTSTGIGKSIVSAAIISALAADQKVAAFKPVVTGTDEPAEDWPRDHELLASASGWQTPDEVTPLLFGPAVSPHLGAEMSGSQIDPAPLVAHALELALDRFLVVEGVGGLLVPLNDETLIRDFARELGLPLLIVASPGLGTINHTLLTIEAARTVGLNVAGVVLNQWPLDPSEIEISNERTIAQLGNVTVARFPHVIPEDLASEGKRLLTSLADQAASASERSSSSSM